MVCQFREYSSWYLKQGAGMQCTASKWFAFYLKDQTFLCCVSWSSTLGQLLFLLYVFLNTFLLILSRYNAIDTVLFYYVVFKALYSLIPHYISDLLCPHSAFRPLRSSNKFLLYIPRSQLRSQRGRTSPAQCQGCGTVYPSLSDSLLLLIYLKPIWRLTFSLRPTPLYMTSQ